MPISYINQLFVKQAPIKREVNTLQKPIIHKAIQKKGYGVIHKKFACQWENIPFQSKCQKASLTPGACKILHNAHLSMK